MKINLMHGMAGLFLAAISTSAMAETWIARCNNLQFNFDRTSKTFFVYFSTSTGIYQMARGRIIFDNGTAIRGPIEANGVGSDGNPITQIGLNPSRSLVYVMYDHPTTNEVKNGDFCTTRIQSVP
ncbi:MAG: hypothetical protein RIQ81_1777 [Pseudomonadota bacterium]|jgi:hypothetical protein